ncbi:DUF2076 domain-containing protein [Roseomonas fluvialis]|uniref:DUF2076 domain-containing protein n=1 Tax=Roseomonas fluvialis TaxID=1750527 RepID=A0ABM7Y7K2_9PROT|nr:DUF2076 family protein [Roseomonas fluvialis]BDG73919.1 hypothetical protein Rmf_38480 [Roseomonas fluvialis]
MTDEERRIITAFVERMSGAAPIAQAPSGPWGATGPARVPTLPPVDPEADRLINDLFARLPEARYRITQSAFVQEAALIEATNRIQQLEWEVENARRQGQAQAAQAGGGGMFGGLFGGRSNAPMPPAMPPRPQPQFPPGYNPQALQQQSRGGMGFLGTAAAAAAGVAGGMLLGNMLMGALGGGAAQAAGLGADAAPVSDPGAAGGWGADDAAPAGGGYQDAAAEPQDAWGADDGGGDWGGDEEI